MALSDWEYSYNGLTFGGNTQYGVTRVEGLDPPDTKADIRPKIGVDGSFVYAVNYEERHVIITGDIVPTSGLVADLEPLINTWRTAFANQTADLNLDYKPAGVPARRIKCRPIRRNLVVDEVFQLAIARWTVELVAGDPAIYAVATGVKLFEA